MRYILRFSASFLLLLFSSSFVAAASDSDVDARESEWGSDVGATESEWGSDLPSPDDTWSDEETPWASAVRLSRKLDASGACGIEQFIGAEADSETWEEISRIKRKTGFAPEPEELDFELEYGRKDYFGRFTERLNSLNHNIPTFLLAFGDAEYLTNDESPCIWLFSSNGLVAIGRVKGQYDSILTGLVGSMGVDNRVATRTKRPRSNSDCEDLVSVSDIGRTESQLNGANYALAFAGGSLLPPEISQPLLKATAHKRARLLVLPTDNLSNIPFAALKIGDTHLVDRFSTVILPTIKSFYESASATHKKSFSKNEAVLVGNPDLSWDSKNCWADLPSAADEIKFAADKLSVKGALTGRDATYKAVFKQLRERQKTLKFVFFATHGVADSINPADGSYLALNGKFLLASDLRRLNFKSSPLVLLSACQTGLGKLFPKRGVFGLAESWRHAGASAVIVSLWKVDDKGTGLLMRRFIDGYASKPDLSVEFALSEAILSVKNDIHDPAIWGSFSYYGPPSE